MNLYDESETSWAQIDFAESVDSMSYMSSTINIYKTLMSETQTEERYYFAPKNLLVCDSATYEYSKSSGWKHATRFTIEMWDEQMRATVVNYLRSRESNTNNPTIQHCNVRVIPFEEVKLVALDFAYKMPTYWTSVGQSPQVVSLSLTCDSQSAAEELTRDVRQHRSYFRHFKLLLRLKQDTRKQPIVIRVEDILAGNMMTTLRQRFGNQVLLTADDEEKLVMESTTRVLAETFNSETAQIVETEIAEKITRLISSREFIIDERSEVWNSVLWNDDNYRPDKLANSLNLNEAYYELYVTDNVNKMNFPLDFEKTLLARTAFLKLAANSNIDLSNTESQSSLEFGKFCTEIKKHLDWNGERFVPKPLYLTRIYLEQEYQRVLKVRIDFLTIAIIVPDIGDNSLVEQPVRRWNDEFLTTPIVDLLSNRRYTNRLNNVYLKTGKKNPYSKL